MKNYEKYADEIRNYEGNNLCCDFIKQYILKSDNCADMSCYKCHMLQMLWLLEDCKEPEVDWSKVEVDTPILVRFNEHTSWVRRHFVKYEDGVIYAWNDGRTSWTEDDVTAWNYAKLAESNER